MILHANAALSRRQRERLVLLVGAGTTITAAALGCRLFAADRLEVDRQGAPRRGPRRSLVAAASLAAAYACCG